jgi:DNA-binding PadR family transcriptional regulator
VRPANQDDKKVREQKIIHGHIEQLLFDVKRGFLQFIVIALIDQRPRYAYEIKNEVFRITKGTFDIDRNNLYKKLRTLEADGILKSEEEPSSHGANRKYYSLTAFGKKFLKEISRLMLPVIDSFYEHIRKS